MLAAFPTLGNRIWRRVAALALFFALLFGLIAFAQLKFVRQQYFVEDEREQLQQTVADVTHVLFANRHWTLEQYRRTGTDLAAHEYVIVTSDGLLVDSAVKRPAIFASALPIGSLDDSEIKTVATELNETWLLGTRKIGGGRAFVGMIHESDLRNPDRVISADLAAFGVRHRFWSFDGKTVLRVFVPRGNEVVYLVDGVTYVRQMTSVRTAGPSELQSILKSWRRRPGR